jgi:hypothetical protein
MDTTGELQPVIGTKLHRTWSALCTFLTYYCGGSLVRSILWCTSKIKLARPILEALIRHVAQVYVKGDWQLVPKQSRGRAERFIKIRQVSGTWNVMKSAF